MPLKNTTLGEKIQFDFESSRFGLILGAQSSEGFCALFLGDDPLKLKAELQNRFPKAQLIEGCASLKSLIGKIIKWVEDPCLPLNVKLDARGTFFQKTVWKALLEIPRGSTCSYHEIAKKIGKPKAFRAVGRACATNPISLIIPCHRVVKSSGALSGYAWGVSIKKTLLEIESA